MISNIHMIINIMALGLIAWIFGIKENEHSKQLVGKILISIAIILNTISIFSGE